MRMPKFPLLEHLVTKNPMMAEVTRFRKRFLSFRGSSVAVNGGIGIVLVCYAFFAIGCVYYRGEFDPITLIQWFLGISAFAIPLTLHASIAGERERRSWDMLLVAPITHGQIVLGKFMGAMAGLTMCFGLYLIPVAIDALYTPQATFINFFLASLTVILQGASLIAMTILISSRVKRPLVALGVSIAAILLYFLFIPGLLTGFSSFTGTFIVGSVNPFFVIDRISRSQSMSGMNFDADSFSIYSLDKLSLVFTHATYQIVLTIALLAWAIKTLVFADNEVKFIPKSKANARSKKSA